MVHDHDIKRSKLYEDSEALKKLIFGKKYQLDCGHVVTFGHNFGTTAVIINRADLPVICSSCYE
jgi:hypothetical protein